MSEVVDDEAKKIIRIILDIAVRSTISAAGIFTNIFSMVIFAQIGLKDSMSVGLFALSFTDFLVTGFQLASCVCYVTDLFYPTNPVDAWSIGYFVFGFLISATHLISCWITTFVSIERCLCVVSPFKVRQIFTRFRCVTGIASIYIIHIVIHIPVYVTHTMQWTYTEQILDNGSSTVPLNRVFTVVFNDQTAFFELIFDLTVGVGFLFCSQTVVVVCAIRMGYSLEASSRVRESDPNTIPRDGPGLSASSKSASTLSNRERRLVKVVLYLGIILTACNVPRIITATVYHTVLGMDTGHQEILSTTLWATTSAFGSLGCIANFFVYLILNSNYRRRFYQIFVGRDKSLG